MYVMNVNNLWSQKLGKLLNLKKTSGTGQGNKDISIKGLSQLQKNRFLKQYVLWYIVFYIV